MQFTVAIDGPAAAGKGTIARAVAKEFGFQHLDTGLLYRAVGRRVLEGTPAVIAASTLRIRDLSRTDLRTPDVSNAASKVATDPEVRSTLIEFQRNFARRQGGAVLDGRDIGTVICPEAEVKLFVTASDTERARRRWLELSSSGHDRSEEQVLADVRARDARDRARETAPLVVAEAAIIIDTTEMDVANGISTAIGIVADAVESARN